MSSKVLEQFEFLKDVAKLIYFADQQGIVLTGGDLYRSKEQQQIYYDSGKSTTMNSKHRDRLAIDFNFFIKGVLTYAKKDIQVLGDYWEAINKSKNSTNVWGGNWESFVDVPHFERRLN